MLFRPETLAGIREGRVEAAFRRWTRPRVRPGTRHRVAGGVVEITSVEEVGEPGRLTDRDARAAGLPDAAALRAALRGRDGDPVFRVGLRWGGEDPRVALREREPTAAELAELEAALDAIDARSRRGPWTRDLLALIAARPAVRAADLAAALGRETLPLKADVRRLKELGLTESLEVGYRLPPRGRAVLAARR